MLVCFSLSQILAAFKSVMLCIGPFAIRFSINNLEFQSSWAYRFSRDDSSVRHPITQVRKIVLFTKWVFYAESRLAKRRTVVVVRFISKLINGIVIRQELIENIN